MWQKTIKAGNDKLGGRQKDKYYKKKCIRNLGAITLSVSVAVLLFYISVKLNSDSLRHILLLCRSRLERCYVTSFFVYCLARRHCHRIDEIQQKRRIITLILLGSTPLSDVFIHHIFHIHLIKGQIRGSLKLLFHFQLCS